MTTDDLIPPPPRVVMEIVEIVLALPDNNPVTEEQKQVIKNLSLRFEDVRITGISPSKSTKWSCRNGYTSD